MEAKSGEASVAPVAVATEATAATVSFQPQAAVAEQGSSSGGVLVPPPPMAAGGGGVVVAAAPVAGVVKVGKKRGRPRKYGPDGSLIRPLNATPISASVPMAASAVGPYTPASAVGAAMKRGRGRPLDFASTAKLHHHHQHHHQQQQFGFHFDSIGWYPSPTRISSLPQISSQKKSIKLDLFFFVNPILLKREFNFDFLALRN